VEVQRQKFLTSVLDGSEWSASRPGRSIAGTDWIVNLLLKWMRTAKFAECLQQYQYHNKIVDAATTGVVQLQPS